MRFFWLAPVFVSACADLSGLADLAIDAGSDATTNDAAQQIDASADATSIDAATEAAPLTFCTAEAGASAFCADFDENDVHVAYANGVATTWTNASTPPPTLDFDASVSPPASAEFTPTLLTAPSLSETLNGKPTTLVVSVALRVNASALGTMHPLVVQTDATHTVSIVLTNLNTISAELDETADIGDGGTTITPHPISAGVPTGTWIPLSLTITKTTIELVTFDIVDVNVTRAQNVALSNPIVSFGFGLESSGEIDDVVVTTAQ